MSFALQDWKDGVRPPKGWDCADAIEDNWTREDLNWFMKEAVCDELPPWREPEPEPEPEPELEPDEESEPEEPDGDLADIPDQPLAPTNQPVIEYQEHALPLIVTTACRALINADVELYARGTSLVRPVSLAAAGEHKGVKRRQGALVLVPVDETALVEILTDHIEWRKYDGRGDKWKPVAAPAAVAKTIISRRGNWPFPQLVAVVTAPTLRHDWSVLDAKGFDGATGIYFSSGIEWPTLKPRPTRDDALTALAELHQLLADFPFVSEADLAGALAMILTALIRPSLPTAPLFGISAPVPGSGKSKLVDIASILSSGRNAAVMSASREEPELQKGLSAALMAGDGFLSLDNVEHALRSEFLCQVLTQGAVKARVLGQSLNLDLPTSATLCATGNGLRFAGDLTRRVVLINLDPGTERPEERCFDRDAVEVARRDRVKLVMAGLTILRAFILSEAPAVRPALGSFEVWSNVVRSALVWLGAADPLSNASRVRDDDPERERTAAIIRALPRGQWHASEVAEMLRSDAGRPSHAKEHAALTEALAEFVDRGGNLSINGFGMFLRKHRDRIIDGRRIVRAGERHRVALWRVENLAADDDAEPMHRLHPRLS